MADTNDTPPALLRAKQKLAEQAKVGAHTLPNNADRNGNNDTLLIPESDVQDASTDQDRGTPATSSIKHPQSPGNFRPHEDVSQRKNYQQFTFDAPDPQRQPPPAGILTAEPATNTGKDKRNDEQQPIPNGHDTQRPTVYQWKNFLYEMGKQGVELLIKENPAHREAVQAAPIEGFVEQVQRLRNGKDWMTHDPALLSATEIDEEIHTIATALHKVYVPAVRTNAAAAKPENENLLTPLTVGQLYDLVDEWDRQPWVWDGILPHASLSLLVGKSETGKSTLIYALIYAILKGLRFFSRQCEQGRVLYLAGDPMSEIVAGKTFRELGVDRDEGLRVIPGALVNNPTALPQLRQIAKSFRPALIVGDTLAATVSLDVDKYGESYSSQQPLSKIARESFANFLVSHHSQKAAIESYSVIDAALGSVGVAAVASSRMVTRMYRRQGKTFHTFQMSNLRIGTPIEGEWIVNKLPNGLVELDGLWSQRETEMVTEAIKKVVAESSEPISQTNIRDALGMKLTRGQLWLALKELVANKWIRLASQGKKGGAKKYVVGDGPDASNN